MRKIYSGDIKLLYIKGFENKSVNGLSINPDCLDFVFDDKVVLMKDAKFYYNWTGRLISFDANDYIESRYDAEELLRDCPNIKSVRYADYDKIKFERDLTNKEFKQLKKEYKNKKA